MTAYQRCLKILRESEKPKSIRRLTELRDQNESKKVALEASKFLATDEQNGPGIALTLNVDVQPGYIIDVSRHAEKAKQILDQQRSK